MRFRDYKSYPPPTLDKIWNGVNLLLERSSDVHVDVLLGQTVDPTYETKLFEHASADGTKGRYRIRKLKASGSLMNFLILEHNEEDDKEVLFGWGRHHSDRDGVIHSNDQRVVRRFSALYDRLFSDEMSVPMHNFDSTTRRLSIESAAREILGWWTYEVRSLSGKFSHSGRCEIFEDGGHLKISGERVFRHTSKNKKEVICVNNHWHTDWCQICSDHDVRFVYNITVEKAAGGDVRIRGLCEVKFDARKMAGHYNLLAPSEEDTVNIQSGTIIFTRSHDDPTLLPPEGFRVGDDVANS